MRTYELNLFGGFELRDDSGSAISVEVKKSRCLLTYLALSRGQPIHRDQLVSLLWGDRPDKPARHCLSQELYRLRQIFSEQAHTMFQLSGETIGLPSDLLDVDVIRFENHVSSGDLRLVEAAVSDYDHNVMADLTVGEDEFDEWLRTRREHLRDRAITGWRGVLQAQMNGPTEPAIASALQLLSIEPTDEETHRTLMELYTQAGRRDLALKQYKKCKAVLTAELGVEPDSRTRELHEIICAESEEWAVKATPPESFHLHPGEASLVVLPFTNKSGDPEQDYLADGITEDLVTAIAKVPRIFIISCDATFAYRSKSARTVGRECGVSHVLEGSVQRDGGRIRISAQLVETESGRHLWSDRFDRVLDEIFSLQDEITLRIATELQVKLTEGEQARLRYTTTRNVDAWDYWMKGLGAFRERSREGVLSARRMWERSVELDPQAAGIIAMLGLTYWMEALEGWSDSREKSLTLALESAHKAMSLNDTAYEAQAVIGLCHLLERNHAKAIAACRRSVTDGPNCADTLASLAWVLDSASQYDEAISCIEKAIRFNPIRPIWYGWILCHALRMSGRNEQALSAILEYRERDSAFGHIDLVIIYGKLGRDEDARAEVNALLKLEPEFSLSRRAKALYYVDPAQLDHDAKWLRKAGLPE